MLSAGYATAVAHAVRHLTDEQTARAEPILLELADSGGTADDVAAMGKIILDAIDPDGRSAREKTKTENQHLTIASGWGGMGRITGLLDPELTALLRSWLGSRWPSKPGRTIPGHGRGAWSTPCSHACRTAGDGP